MNDYISIISSLIIFIFPYIGRKWFNIQSLSSIAIRKVAGCPRPTQGAASAPLCFRLFQKLSGDRKSVV